MALSEKHEGKILVPWFCSEEWKYVYRLIYSESSTQLTKHEALDILKIWKIRMPLLSSGVEGTLIILGAILTDTNAINEESVCLLYATSIMRFLNLCAANNRRQGTFYETARRNNLPDWLINVRHDLAHDQRVPSKSLLTFCLNYCLEWLKNEYWEKQSELITDFIAVPVMFNKDDLTKYIHTYGTIVLNAMENNAKFVKYLDRDITKQLDDLFKYKINRMSTVIYVLQELLKLVETIACDGTKEDIAEYIANSIVSHGSIFEIPDNPSEVNEDDVCFNNFRSLWAPLFVMLNQTNMLLPLIQSLLNCATVETNDFKTRDVSAWWLNEIFRGLLGNTTGENNPMEVENNFTDTRVIVDSDDIMLERICKNVAMELKLLLNDSLENPNTFTLTYLRNLMLLNNCTDEHIKEMEMLIISYIEVKKENLTPVDKIYTADDLSHVLKTIEIVQPVDSKQVTFPVPIQVEDNTSKSNKWEQVEDTAAFKGCPLGVLPHQKRTRNPLLQYSF